MGKLYLANPPISCQKQHRVFETLYCDQCGAIFWGGSRLEREDGGPELLQTTPNVEKIPDEHIVQFVEKRTYENYALFWPLPEEKDINPEVSNSEWNQPRVSGSSRRACASWKKATLNKITGKNKI